MKKNYYINPVVFGGSAIIILMVTLLAAFFPNLLSQKLGILQHWLSLNTGWIYVLFVGIILFTAFWLIGSRLGDIKLGPDHSEPEFSNLSWFTMLFSAGMGIGLMFWGVAEPLMHFYAPPKGTSLTIESAEEAMKITFFHWGLHAWALYGVLAVALAYYSYRKYLPLLPRSLLYPFIGDNIHGRWGDLIDIFAITGTMFGVAASLGLGVTQLNAGLHYLFEVPQSINVQLSLIAAVTGLATCSVVLGLEKGIKNLSNLNVLLAALLALAVLLVGNTIELLQAFIQNTGAYLSEITHKTFNLYAYERKNDWIGGWTLLYWSWWIAWSPFVSIFIARISKGRTIREFMVGVLVAPTLFTFLWMTIFGNSAIDLVASGKASGLVDIVNENMPIALFHFFEFFPGTSIFSLLALILVVTFFVSSSDSGSLVIDTIASGGEKNPPLWQKVFWAITEGLVAGTVLVAGGLDALQTITIISALPVIVMISVGVYGLIHSLHDDYLLLTSVKQHNTVIQYTKTDSTWKDRLDALVTHPKNGEALNFLKSTARPALQELADEMKKKQLDVVLNEKAKESVALIIKNRDVENFCYKIQLRKFEMPDYAKDDGQSYYRAEVFLLNGGQDYDVFGYTKDQIVADVITQYEKHYHFLHRVNSELT